MDGYQSYAVNEAHRFGIAARPGERKARSFLFLQGPISTFFDRLGRALIARGHRVHRVNLHFGDRLLWRLPATAFRGGFADWRPFIAELLERHKVTDLVLHGDRRPYHLVAAEEARARGIAVIATDLGYLRPDWLTLEYDGLTTYSRFPRDPEAIRALAEEFPEPELGARFQTPFWLIAALDIAYNLGLVFGRPLYPGYRYHSTCHPFLEYAGWIKSRPKKLLIARATAAAKRRLQEKPGSYFLVPLQLTTDFQIRAHSPFADVREAVREILASFAASASPRQLVFIVHPLDNGLIDWRRFVARLARQFGVADRVFALHGGTPADLLRNAAGVVTINSTVGITALCHGVPVKTLGNAVFDVAGLTCQSSLDAFWHCPSEPDRELLRAFLRALVGATQIKGGYYERSSQACAVAGFVERLERRPYPLLPLEPAELAARAPRASTQTIAVTGIVDALTAALARRFAAPGVRLCLAGRDGEMLERTARDCRLRGALVETVHRSAADGSPMSGRLAAFDRRTPVDLLVACGSAGAGPGGGLAAAMDAVAALAEPMRRRGTGRIALVSGACGHAVPNARRTAGAWRAYAAALRGRLRRDGIAVVVAAPGGIATRAWLAEPRRAAAGDERVAERVARGLRQRQSVIAAPGALAVIAQAVRHLPAHAREAIRRSLPQVDPLAEAAEERPLAGRPGAGD